MSRIIRCKLCSIKVKCKHLGRPKIYCTTCWIKKSLEEKKAYMKKHRKKFLLYKQRYREKNREKIREHGRKHAAIKARIRDEYNEKLLADILANPRKYLKRL